MRQLAWLFVGVVALTAASPPPPPTPQECFAAHGFPGTTIYSDGSVDVPAFTMADNNAGQAWDAHSDRAVDACLP